MDWHSLLAYPNPPVTDCGGMISPVEGNRSLVTLIGYGSKEIPKDIDSFKEYAEKLEQPNCMKQLQMQYHSPGK
ncbi:hypothetical protein J7E37_10260 [Bacillus sp. ISL-39]|nr:hypothetical protein [Bacillus sp. ISL-39]